MNPFLIFNKYCLFIFFLLIFFSSLAQGDPPPPPDGGGGPGSVDDVPIHMYGLVLLLAGAYYGTVKKK